MEKSQANVEEIVRNILTLELVESDILNPEIISQISEEYIRSGELVLPEAILTSLEAYEEDLIPPGLEALRNALHQEFTRYVPSAKKLHEDQAEVIIVKVLGMEFETYVDSFGTQRFKSDTAIQTIVDRQLVDLDSIDYEFQSGRITTEDLLSFYTKSGYSVGELSGLSYFSHLTFENPLW